MTEHRKKKKPPNPLKCGCAAMGTPDLNWEARVEYKDIHVVHCPLHAAAADLLFACKAASEADPHGGDQDLWMPIILAAIKATEHPNG